MTNVHRTDIPMTLSEEGEERMLRVSIATAFVADLLYGSCYDGNRTVSGEGVAALFSCLAEQMECVVKQSNRMTEEVHDEQH
jgi:hypothetical protein